MVDKDKRKITKKTVKECKIRGNNYKVVTEENTSITCGSCEKIKKNLKGNEIYKCEKCGLEIDRDLNASRNICIKNIKNREK